MFHMKYLFNFIFLHLIIVTPQKNLYYTDWVSKSEVDNASQHNCLRAAVTHPCAHEDDSCNFNTREILLYCMSELVSKFDIKSNDLFPKFTFDELSKQNITSQQLYLWSTPIDIIERYQLYLNQLSSSKDLLLGKEIYYNCTLSRFGSMCQYEFYEVFRHTKTYFTCYTHLQCNRGPFPSCLDWSEICDGKVDCLDGGLDEEHCWQLEINQCKDDEYRCMNGQCIPQSFYYDNSYTPDCIDSSDRVLSIEYFDDVCSIFHRASFRCDDKRCKYFPLTSSCIKEREDLLLEAMHSNKNNSVPSDCWTAFQYITTILNPKALSYDEKCEYDARMEIIEKTCPDMFYFPDVPVLFGNIYFAYKKNDSHSSNTFLITTLYICYNTSNYDDYFANYSKISFNNMMCIHAEQFLSQSNLELDPYETLYHRSVYALYIVLERYRPVFNYTSTICNKSNMYQCMNSSKCISIHRIMDTVYDCPYIDDENIIRINDTNIIELIGQNYYKCKVPDKYIHKSLFRNGICDCYDANTESQSCEDEYLDINYIKHNVVFQHICDNFIDLLPLIIDGRNETDETECEQWECNNTYTRCNGVWNCPNGADETACHSSSLLNCSSKQHFCVSLRTRHLMCLPIEKANDGNADCLGGTDEPTLCGIYRQSSMGICGSDFYCRNQNSSSCIHSSYLCDGMTQCDHGDDEQFCEKNRTFPVDQGICEGYRPISSDIDKFLCGYCVRHRYWRIMYFTLDRIRKLVEHPMKNIENRIFSSPSMSGISAQDQLHCHHGFQLRISLNKKNNLPKTLCLCPPSLYGNQCQYQNQRISLTIKFRALSDSWQILFAIIISLIDDSNQRIIHSYEQITYLWTENCNTKYNIYLLYATRPKDPTKNYSIHIDFYEKVKLNYHGSLLLPILFPFLPVHRLAFIVDIPRNNDKILKCSNKQCSHGKCMKYSNSPSNLTFCQCNEGWSGQDCTIEHNCICASDSLCIGVSANNRSICVCPLSRFGSRCLLTDTICQTNGNSTCQNNGQCIPDHDSIELYQKFICICPPGFSGDRCELLDNNLTLSFNKDIILPQSMIIHFFEVFENQLPIRSTTFRTIPIKQDSVNIYWAQPFHLVFIELTVKNKNYYLTVVQEIYNRPTKIIKMINPSDRCSNISELFNETFLNLPLIRRIKSYHLPCQNQSLNLSCFYDNIHLCLCYNFGEKRLANCFEFNHNMTFNCNDQSECENEGECFQDNPTCPRRSMCKCLPCYYGRRCQFSARGFGLSLDAILGYHILPHLSLNKQPFITKLSLALIIIFFIIGLINSILSTITFKNKSVREVGCGLYLLCSSVITLFTMIIFGLKFFILLLAQMTTISNRSFLLFQCYSFDLILRVCLHMDQWLNASVAVERAYTVIKGARFMKKKSKQTAKYTIIILFIMIIGTNIHDPIYRQLIDEGSDDDVKRTWCVVSYSSNLHVYNSVMNAFHFFGPFLINLISAIVLIIKKSRQQLTIDKHRTYIEVLRKQFKEHKHLLTSPIILIFLALPRLILTYMSKCMKSANDSWLFLFGYFISFIPPMLTFVVFILPSKYYKKEFYKSVRQFRTTRR